MNWKTQIFADKDKEKKNLYRRFKTINADKKKKVKSLEETPQRSQSFSQRTQRRQK